MQIKFSALREHVKFSEGGVSIDIDADFVDPNSFEIIGDNSFTKKRLSEIMNDMSNEDIIEAIQDVFSPEDLVDVDVDTDIEYKWV